MYDNFRVGDLRLDVLILLLQLLDDVQVLLRDVVVVLLHLSEGALMVVHQVIDVVVFALFNFVKLDFHAEGKFFFKGLEFALIFPDKLLLLTLKCR